MSNESFSLQDKQHGLPSLSLNVLVLDFPLFLSAAMLQNYCPALRAFLGVCLRLV
jgi:hypothetical protein